MRPKSVAGWQRPERAPASRRRGARRRTRRRPPGRRSARAASPAARAPSARRGAARATRSRRDRASSSRSSAAAASRRGVGAGGLVDLGEERLERLRARGPSRAARRGTARCPSPPRSSSAATRGRGAASRTPRRSRCRRSTRAPRPRGRTARLQSPVLEHRVGEPLERVSPLVAGDRLVVGARQAHRADRRRLGLDREVGEHVPHQRLVDQRACRTPRGASVWWIACGDACAHPGRRPEQQSRRVWLTISMIVGTPRPSSPTIRAQAPRNSTSLDALERLPSLSLRRWMLDARCARRRA